MTLRLAIAATGTGVGKTTTALAVLRAARRLGHRVAGWKPIETGGTDDGDALQAASNVRCPTLVQLPEPISPHLAARRAGAPIDLATLAAEAPTPRVDLFLIETAGGLFSPLDDAGATNAELVEALAPDALLLVAPNRLGVLHDVAAVRRGAPKLAPRTVAVALTGGDAADPSTSSNAAELARLHGLPVWSFPYVSAEPLELVRWLSRRLG